MRVPVFVVFNLLKTMLKKRFVSFLSNNKHDFTFSNDLKFTADFFSHNIPYIYEIIEENGYLERHSAIDILEIGSFEGRSTLYLLSKINNSNIVCVDPFSGSLEHQYGHGILSELEGTIEDRFDYNTSRFSGRIKKIKSRSDSFFLDLNKNIKFDLIYIDGSHYADDVLRDAISAFSVVKVGGIIFFDDYLWEWYGDKGLNPYFSPCFAINMFLKLKKGQYKLLKTYHQVAIKKIN